MRHKFWLSDEYGNKKTAEEKGLSFAVFYIKNIYNTVLYSFAITSCTELEDRWVFFANSKNTIAIIPPLEVMKNGKDIDIWEKYYEFNNCFEAAAWLNENGKDIIITDIEKM